LAFEVNRWRQPDAAEQVNREPLPADAKDDTVSSFVHGDHPALLLVGTTLVRFGMHTA
jgi:hypothetical protein